MVSIYISEAHTQVRISKLSHVRIFPSCHKSEFFFWLLSQVKINLCFKIINSLKICLRFVYENISKSQM